MRPLKLCVLTCALLMSRHLIAQDAFAGRLDQVRVFLGQVEDAKPSERDLTLALYHGDSKRRRVLLTKPVAIDSDKAWKSAVETGIVFTLPKSPKIFDTDATTLWLSVQGSDSRWNHRLLIIGRADDDGLESVLASVDNVSSPTWVQCKSVADFTRRKSKDTPLYFLLRGEFSERIKGSSVLLQIRQKIQAGGQTSANIVASYLISDAWQWNVLRQHGLIIDFRPGAETMTTRYVVARMAHECELVAYAGTPLSPQSVSLDSLKLKVIGYPYTSNAQSFPDLSTAEFLLTAEEPADASVKDIPSDVYNRFSPELREWRWSFEPVVVQDNSDMDVHQ